MRRSSCEFAAKCFTHALTPVLCMPRIIAAASLPESSGSSEKYSKFRPQSGLRLMFTPGPSTMPTPCATASSPSARPTAESSVSSQLFASALAVGKHVAGTERPRPSASESLSCLRRPCGPSVIISDGMPSRSTAFRVPEIPSGREPRLFLQRQLGNEIVRISYARPPHTIIIINCIIAKNPPDGNTLSGGQLFSFR